MTSIVRLVSAPLLAIVLLVGCQSSTAGSDPTLRVTNASAVSVVISVGGPLGQVTTFGNVGPATQRCFTLPGIDSDSIYVSASGPVLWFRPAQSPGWSLAISGSQVTLTGEANRCTSN